MPPARRPRRRLLAALLGAMLGLLALELVMQAIAYALWLGAESAVPAAAPGAATVLCAGDSFTHGLGASDSALSYPRVLEARLARAEPGRWIVVNRGQPGRDSARLLRELPRWLEELRPRWVLVLVGYNDRWALEPEVVAAGAATERRFPLRLRSLELLRRIAQWSGPEGDKTGEGEHPAALRGLWHQGTLEVRLEPDGSARVGELELRWRVVAGELRLGTDPASERPVPFTLDGERLTLECSWLEPSQVTLTRGGAERDPRVLAREAVRERRLDEARALLEHHDPSSSWHGIRVELAAAQQRAREVEQGLAALRAAAAADPWQQGEVVRVLLAIGRTDEGFALAQQHLQSKVADVPVWIELLDLVQREPRYLPALLAQVEQALGGTLDDDGWRWRLISTRALLLDRLGRDAIAALSDAFRAGLMLGQFHIAIAMLERDPARYGAEVIEQARARLGATPDEARTLDRVVEIATRAADTASGRLERHLLRCAELCHRHGARLVLLTYPEPMPLDGAIRRAAAATGVELLDLQPVFAEELRRRPWGELFVLDGHCNDHGYALMAEAVLRTLTR